MRWPAWLGVGERRWKKSPDEEVQPPKTAWDFLQLLIVPAILVAIALAFNAAQASRDRSREDRRIREDRALAETAREDAVVDDYLATMRGLMLDRDLTRAKEGSAVRQVARTATLTTLRRLDGRRKGEVVRFLYEARLLDGGAPRFPVPVIDLEGADLRGVDLAEAALEVDVYDPIRIFLTGDLRGAKFDHAVLGGVAFSGTKLRGASFNGAEIRETSLSNLDLREASFKGAILEGVDFHSSDLRGSIFDNASILLGTRFVATCLTDASFAGATFNQETTVDATLEERDLIGDKTTFLGAKGHDADFSDAVNLSSVRLSPEVTEVHFGDAKERPKRPARLPLYGTDEEAICN